MVSTSPPAEHGGLDRLDRRPPVVEEGALAPVSKPPVRRAPTAPWSRQARPPSTVASTGSTDEHRWLRRAPWRPSRNHPYGERRPHHGLDKLDRRARWPRQARPTPSGGLAKSRRRPTTAVDKLDRRPTGRI